MGAAPVPACFGFLCRRLAITTWDRAGGAAIHSARNSFRQRVQPFKQPACSQSSHHLLTSATTKVAVRPAFPQCLGMRAAACVVVFLLSFLEFAMAQDHVTPFLDQVLSHTLMSGTPLTFRSSVLFL